MMISVKLSVGQFPLHGLLLAIIWQHRGGGRCGDSKGAQGLTTQSDPADLGAADKASVPATDAARTIAELAELRYRRLVDHCPDAICVHENGRIVYVNPAGVRWMAAESAAQLVGHRITDFVHADSIPAMLARISLLREEGDTSEPSETRLLRFDGTMLEVEAVSVLTAWDGRPAYQVVFRDLSAQKAAEATLRYQAALVNHVSDAIIATTPTGMVTSWNPAAEAIYRRPATQALATPVSDAVGAPLDPAEIVAAGGIVHTTHHARDGSTLAVRVSAAAMDNGYVLVSCDQTALRRAERYFQTVVSSLEEGVVVFGPDGHIETVNPAALRLFGVDGEDLPTDHEQRARAFPLYDESGRAVEMGRRPVIETLQTGQPAEAIVLGVDHPDGRRVWLSGGTRLLNPDDPHNSAVLLSVRDVTAQRERNERLARDAYHDALTGLPNRAHIENRLTQAVQPANRGSVAAVFYIDLDNLKTINDSVGHHAGDTAIQVAAQRLRAALRTDDIVGRLGGDEFVAVLTANTSRQDLDQLAARLHDALSQPVIIDDETFTLSASIGITVVKAGDPRSASQLLRDADRAMYQAKTAGHGQSRYFADDLSRRGA
jgi:diguanylate cyclase (GGDEF)-like protein/PAS domain S-box-containing protein